MKFYRSTNLQEMCLNVIIHDLESHHFKYENTPENNFFLKSQYSVQIYATMKKKDKISMESLTWLLSPFWTDLTIPSTHVLSEYIPRLNANGSVIQSISFENSAADVLIIGAIICLIPNVQSINLDGTNCDDDLLLLMRRMCPKLTNLSLYECNVSDAGIMCSTGVVKDAFKSMKKLNIFRTKVSLKGTKYLLKNFNLDILVCSNLQDAICTIHKKSDKDIDYFKIQNLEFFDPKSPVDFDETLNAYVAMCPNAERITIVNHLSDDHFEKLSTFKNLTFFEFYSLEAVESPGLDKFLTIRGENLTQLYLSRVCASVDVITKHCPNLIQLTMVNIQYDESAEISSTKTIHNLNKLSELRLYDAELNHKPTLISFCLLLVSCPAIQKLVFRKVKYFVDIFVEIITHLPYLSQVKFLYVDIEHASAKQLFASENIHLLSLDHCPHVKFEECHQSGDVLISGKGNTLSWQINYSP